jgi:hypothetical protein
MCERKISCEMDAPLPVEKHAIGSGLPDRQCMRRLTGTRIVLDHGEEIGLFVGWVPALA